MSETDKPVAYDTRAGDNSHNTFTGEKAMFPTSCTHCGKEYDVGLAFVEKQVTCHSCHQPFVAETTEQYREAVSKMRSLPAQASRRDPLADPLGDLGDLPGSPAPSGGTKNRKPGKKQRGTGRRKLKIVLTDQGLYALAPWDYILTCPGTWLVAMSVFYCLLAMCLLQGSWLRSLEPAPLLIAGVIGFVGVCIQGRYFYWKWTDLGELEKQKEQLAGDPPWIRTSLAAIVLLPMVGGMMWGKGWFKYDAKQVVAELTDPIAPNQAVAQPVATPQPSAPAPVAPAPVAPENPVPVPGPRAAPRFPINPPTGVPQPFNPPGTSPPAARGSGTLSQDLAILKKNSPFDSVGAARRIAAMQPIDARRAEVLAALLSALQGDSVLMQGDLLQAIVVWKDADTPLKLVKILETSQEVPLHWALLETLGKLNDPRTAPAIARRVSVPTDSLQAVQALQAMGPVAESAVIPLLKSDDFAVQTQICDMLGKIGTSKSIPALRAVQQSDNPITQRFAAEAIQAIQARGK